MEDFVIDYGKLNDALGIDGSGAIKSSSNNSVFTLGDIIGGILPYLLTIAGIILFGMLVFGGFTMLAGAADKESQESGKKMITSALVGFFVIFAAYWIAQLLQVIFRINILS